MNQRILAADNVWVVFGGLVAVKEVSLEVAAGTVVGVIGPNGAGKTTLFNAVSGHVPMSSGTVTFLGQDVTRLSAPERARRGMARTFQLGGLIDRLTALENVALGVDHRHRSEVGRASTRGTRETALNCLEQLGLGSVAFRITGELAAGTKRLVEVARAVAAGPHLILLDEPAVGLTEADRGHLVEAIGRLAAAGTAILLTDHTTDFVFSACSRVYVMDFGEVIASGPPQQVRQEAQVIDAYLGSTTRGKP